MKQTEQIDRDIAWAEKLKQRAEAAAAQYEAFKKRTLIPLAKHYGVRDGDSWRLQGAKNKATITARHELALTMRGISYAATHPELLEGYVRTLAQYKPLRALYQLWHDRRAWATAGRALRAFLQRGVRVRRSWAIRLEVKK